ncbi:alpha/beta hydrolase [Nocardioides speluncae]|uniref:alpha/beta hydrolase n=1 Tax=Nocardioides speluncae TaxID=2670337 RepID=UPI000D69D569|nr:alpha/beta hydrolase [Nocardioides speluncae]
MTRAVEFVSDGVRLSGVLRVPDGAGPFPGVVLTGPLSGVKEQVAGLYAEKLAAAGFATLAFDHRNFGASAGEPRQHEDPHGKLHDLRDAVSFLRSQPEVDRDRIGCVGVCLGGGYALRAAAFDPRICALATVAGGYNDPRGMQAGMGDGYRSLLTAQLEATEDAVGPAYLNAVDGGPHDGTVMQGEEPAAYYGTERSASPGWVNQLTAASIYELVTVDLGGAGDFISPTPWLMVHGEADDYCTPDQARAAFARAGSPKRDVWLPAKLHIDLYDVPEYVGPAVAEITTWFREHLSGPSGTTW